MEDRCTCCGAIIPEGQQVCYRCMEGGSMRKVSLLKEMLIEFKITYIYWKDYRYAMKLLKCRDKAVDFILKYKDIQFQMPVVETDYKRLAEKLRNGVYKI